MRWRWPETAPQWCVVEAFKPDVVILEILLRICPGGNRAHRQGHQEGYPGDLLLHCVLPGPRVFGCGCFVVKSTT